MASGGVAAAICRRASSLFITPTSEAVTAFSVFHRSSLLSSLLSYLTAYKAVGAARCGGSRARAQRPLKTLAALDLDPPPRGGSSSVVQEIVDTHIFSSVVGSTCRELCFIRIISIHTLKVARHGP